MKFIISIKDTAKLPDIDEVHQLIKSFAKIYPDVIEGIETDLLNSPHDAKKEEK